MTPPPSVCVSCRQPLAAYFQIVRYDAAHTPTITVVCCSLACLVRWAYEYGTLTGMKAVYQTRSFITDLLNSLSPTKVPPKGSKP